MILYIFVFISYLYYMLLRKILIIFIAAFRLGKTIDMLHSANQAYSSTPDPILRYLLVLSRVSYSFYYLYDLLGWCLKSGLLKADSEKLTRRSSRWWSMALCLTLLRDAYELRLNRNQHRDAKTERGVLEILANNPPLAVDTVKNLADLIVALHTWKKLTLSQGTVGLAGVISSLMGLIQVVFPTYKLLP